MNNANDRMDFVTTDFVKAFLPSGIWVKPNLVAMRNVSQAEDRMQLSLFVFEKLKKKIKS